MRARLATPDDLPVLKKLVGYFWDEQHEKYGLPRMDAVSMSIISYGIATGQPVVVAEHNLEVVGWTARVQMPGLPKGLAVGVGKWTFEPFRKEGVCRDMCRLADRLALEQGATALDGMVAKDNEAGLRSALADGWVVVGYSIRKTLTERATRTEEAQP